MANDTKMGVDLETWRLSKGLSYSGLAAALSTEYHTANKMRARNVSIGVQWPCTEFLQTILAKTRGEVTIEAMHRRRVEYLSSQGRLRVTQAAE